MPAPAFFARYTSEFARQLGSSQENADRQVSAQRLLAKAEYELYQLRRELSDVIEYTQPAAGELEEVTPPPLAARAA
jgi:hypothetical protein